MKKSVLFLVFNILLLFSVSAQNNQEASANEGAERIPAQQNQNQNQNQNQKDSNDDDAKRKNFFLGVGVKGDVYVNDNGAHDIEVWKKPTLAGNIFMGKWFSHYFGSRIVLEGGQLNPYFQKRTVTEEEYYFLARLDLLFDFTNGLRSYSPDSFYSLIPYIGIGGEHSFNAKDRPDKAYNSSSFLFGVGLYNTFRLSDKLSAYLNVGLDLVNANSDGWGNVKNINGIAGASIGAVINF